MIKFGWLMWSDFKTTRFDHHSEHLRILGFCMMDGHSYLDISVISCKLRTSSSKLSRAISGWNSCQSKMASWRNCSGDEYERAGFGLRHLSTSGSTPGYGCSHSEQRPPEKSWLKQKVFAMEKKTMKNNYYTLPFNIWHNANFLKIELNSKGNCPELATVYHIPESFQAPLRWSVLS